MMNLQDYRKVLADLNEQRREIEVLLARDLKQELLRINNAIDLFTAQMERFQVPPASTHDRPEIYVGLKSLADLCVACLRSVDHAWLSPTEIAERLIVARVVTQSRGLTGHIGTALSRRMASRLSPDPELEREKGRFRLKPAKAAYAEATN